MSRHVTRAVTWQHSSPVRVLFTCFHINISKVVFLYDSTSNAISFVSLNINHTSGVVGCGEGHRGVQQILVYSWARPAIHVAGKGGGGVGIFLFLLFLFFHSCSSFFPVSLFYLHYYLFFVFSPFLWEMTQNDQQGLACRKTPTQSINHTSLYKF